MMWFLINSDPSIWLEADLTTGQWAQVTVQRAWDQGRGVFVWQVAFPEGWRAQFLGRYDEIEAGVGGVIVSFGLERLDIVVDSVLLTAGLDLDTSDQAAVDAWIAALVADVQV